MGIWVQKCKKVLKRCPEVTNLQFDYEASGIQEICFAKSNIDVDPDPDPDPELANLEILNFT